METKTSYSVIKKTQVDFEENSSLPSSIPGTLGESTTFYPQYADYLYMKLFAFHCHAYTHSNNEVEINQKSLLCGLTMCSVSLLSSPVLFAYSHCTKYIFG